MSNPKIGDRVQTVGWEEDDPNETLIPGLPGTVSSIDEQFIYVKLDEPDGSIDVYPVKIDEFEIYFRLL